MKLQLINKRSGDSVLPRHCNNVIKTLIRYYPHRTALSHNIIMSQS